MNNKPKGFSQKAKNRSPKSERGKIVNKGLYLFLRSNIRKVRNSRRGAFMEMELAKLTSKGQLTVPVAIRKKLNLKEGDKVVFLSDNDGIRMVNASVLALERAQKAFAGEAERLGLKTEQDVVDMVKEVRREISRERNANPD
jgi:AbrB family looped-hinge helix DNA binding protein